MMLHFAPALPITDPVFVLATIMLAVLIIPLLSERLRVPSVVGLLVTGVLIGPHGLHVVERGEIMVFLGTFGLLYVMFLAGLEVDLRLFGQNRSQSIVFGVLSFLLPFALGTATGYLLGYHGAAAVLLGGVFASHTLLAYPIASKLGLGKTRSVVATVGATIITDTLALLVLAIVAGSQRGGLDPWFFGRLAGAFAIYLGLVLWIVPRVGRWFFRTARIQAESEYLFVLAVLFVVAGLAKVAGVEAIVGAFLAGLTLNRLLPERSPLMTRVSVMGNGLFIPMFLLSTGMIVNLAVLREPRVWVVAATMLAVVLCAKYVASWITGRIFRYSAPERWMTFGLSVPQAAATLAATLVGFELRLFDEAAVNGIIILILATSLVGPFVAQRAGRKLVEATGSVPEAREGLELNVARILVPLANPQTAETLVDLALLLRERSQDEPILPLAVVSEDGPDTVERIASAEKMLDRAVVHGAGADVRVVPQARLATDIPAAICRAAVETRASMLIMGWNGEHSLQKWVFGSVIDRVLAGSVATVAVARLAAPLNTAGRIVLIVSPRAERQPGFLTVMTIVSRIARGLGAKLTIWHVTPSGRRNPGRLTRLSAENGGHVEAIADWKGLLWLMSSALEPHDLVVVAGARRGTLAWEPALDKLPMLLASRHTRSFLVVYPPEVLAQVVPPAAVVPVGSLGSADPLSEGQPAREASR